MRYKYSEVIDGIKKLTAGQSLTIACPADARPSAFTQSIRVLVSRYNVDYGTRLRVRWNRQEKTINIGYEPTVAGNGLSALAEVTMREMWADNVSDEGRDLLKKEFQAMLNTYATKLEAKKKPMVLTSVKDDLARRKAEAAEYLARITPKMHVPDDDEPFPAAPSPVIPATDDDVEIEF